MAVRFSDFSTRTGTLDASTRIVGYDDPAGTKTNVEFSLATLADNVPNIYNSDGNILATRIINDRAGGFTGTIGNNALIMNVRPSGAIIVAGYQNNGDPGTTNNCVRWGPGTAAGGVNVRGNLALSGGGGAINLTNSGGGQYLTMAQTGTTINTSVGVGLTSGVSAQLHVKGAGATFATTTFQVENSNGDDLINIRDSGRFAIGLGAYNANDDNVVFGNNAQANGSANNNVVIGHNATTTASNSIIVGGGTTNNDNTIILGSGYINGDEAIAIGNSSRSNLGSVSIGHDSGAENNNGNYNLCLGTRAKNTTNANNVIVLNATGSTTATSGTTDDTFSVFMSSNITPDFKVVGGGESTLNTSLKITGQAYTELHNTTNATLTVNWNDGNIQELTSLTGSLTFTASNPKAGATYILTLAQTGTVTPTWTGVKWPAATAPTLSGSGKTDVITLICYDATGAGLYYGAATLDLA